MDFFFFFCTLFNKDCQKQFAFIWQGQQYTFSVQSQGCVNSLALCHNLVYKTLFSSVQSLSCVRLFATPWTAVHQDSLSITNSRSSPKPMIHCVGCNPTISSSVIPFSSCPQSFPASGSFQMNQLSASGGQSIGISASISVLPMNTQDWSPLGWTSWISLQSKGLSRVFTSTAVRSHQLLSAQPLWSSSHICTRLTEKL